MSDLICSQPRSHGPATHQLCQYGPTNEPSDNFCHPTLRGNIDCSPAQYAGCLNAQDSQYSGLAQDAQYSGLANMQHAVYDGCDPCCDSDNPIRKKCNASCPGHIQSPNIRSQFRHDNQQVNCVSHKCSLGTVVCCSKKRSENKYLDNIPSESCYLQGKGLKPHISTAYERRPEAKERPCCEKKISWNEPRICRCDKYDPNSPACECECGGMVGMKEPEKKKTVRFADEVTYVNCDEEFRSLMPEDVKNLCRCCQECVKKGSETCVGRPVMVYELPEAKLEDTSVTQKDFCWKETPQKEMPPWHPNIKDRWRLLDVPSLAETTYQTDFKPPPVTKTERPPVYLAPQRETKDPCKQLSEEFTTWKKTSTGPAHVHHSNCPKCDADLHRVHLHECDVRNLPAQYQCHGDGHISDCTQNKFTLCETADSVGSKYWWKRSCCTSDGRVVDKHSEVPPNLLKPECPSYTTCYNRDFRAPEDARKNNWENCDVCGNFEQSPRTQDYISLCTRDQNQPLITQRGGII